MDKGDKAVKANKTMIAQVKENMTSKYDISIIALLR